MITSKKLDENAQEVIDSLAKQNAYNGISSEGTDPSSASLLKNILTSKFEYSADADPNYQSYRQRYLKEADKASQNAVAESSATTGGYASTAAVSAGAQAGNYYRSLVADKIPELKQLAYEMYQGDQSDALNKYNALKTQEDDAYTRQKAEEQTAYEHQADARDNLIALISATGYTPTEEELAAAGMSAGQAAAWRNYYLNSMLEGSGGSGGSGGRSSGGSGSGSSNSSTPTKSAASTGKTGLQRAFSSGEKKTSALGSVGSKAAAKVASARASERKAQNYYTQAYNWTAVAQKKGINSGEIAKQLYSYYSKGYITMAQTDYNTRYWDSVSTVLEGSYGSLDAQMKAVREAKDTAAKEARTAAVGKLGVTPDQYLYAQMGSNQQEDYDSVKDDGVSIETYQDVYDYQSNATARKDADGESITGSKKEKVLNYIDGLDILPYQKDALYLCFYAESTLDEAPWN